MALDVTEVIVGPAYVSIGGVDMGFTNDDGVELTPEFDTIKFKGQQALVVSKTHRKEVSMTMKTTFHQLSQAKIAVLQDMVAAPAGGVLNAGWSPTPTNLAIVVTAPGISGYVRSYVMTGNVSNPGTLKHTNADFSDLPVEFDLIGDPTTNRFYVMTETLSSAAAPAVSAYASVSGAGALNTFANGDVDIPDDDVGVQITFDKALRPDMLTDAMFMLVEGAGVAPVAATLTWGTDYTKVVITVTGGLGSSQAYDLIIGKNLKNTSGVGTAAAIACHFTTTS